MSYSPPSSAKPFTLNVPEQDLSEWRQLLQLSKLGPITYENQQTEQNFGVTQKWLAGAKDYWLNTYDWRAQEKHINSFDNFQMQIDGIDLHFVGHFSERKDAVPIVFMHGWPGSFIEFLPMLSLIRDKWSKKDLPYHIIVPSLPGYTLSAGTQPVDKNWTMEDSAEIIHKLMTNLGFEKYLAQGGDVGSFEARLLAQDKDGCVGIHRMLTYPWQFCSLVQLTIAVNMMSVKDQPDPSTLSTFEKNALDRALKWVETGRAYGLEHSSRPSTIGHVLSSNPLALLAWYFQPSHPNYSQPILTTPQGWREIPRMDRRGPQPRHHPHQRLTVLVHRRLSAVHLPIPPTLRDVALAFRIHQQTNRLLVLSVRAVSRHQERAGEELQSGVLQAA
jgi:pimeloyl-ACP methyl ester carboxylesterase